MRIFVSSSFEDLKEHRAAAIRVLRQIGHEVLAMEDLTAASAAPLSKVLDMVDRSEAYVGLFAWRYGYVPGANVDPVTGQQVATAGSQPPVPAPHAQVPIVENAKPGVTSITHYEYLRARQRKLPIMAFLLDEQYAWPPTLIDGFDTTRSTAPANSAQIRALRQQLQQERIVSWFTTPSDLEARVSAAVTMAGLTNQLDLQTADAVESAVGSATDSLAREGIKNAIIGATRENHCALKIDLATDWWLTRLFLLAVLAERLTQVRRILIVDTAETASQTAGAAGAARSGTAGSSARSSVVEERFIGQIATGAILSILGSKRNELEQFQSWLQTRSMAFDDLRTEIEDCLVKWESLFGDALHNPVNEGQAKIQLSTEVLRRWFRDTMLQQPLRIVDLQRASVVDLLRLLDYPSDYVPVLTRHLPKKEGDPVVERVDIMDKKELNRRLARSYLVELMDRARLGQGR